MPANGDGVGDGANEEINEFFQPESGLHRKQTQIICDLQQKFQSLQNTVYLLQEKSLKQQQQIDDLKKEMKGLGSDKDLINTYQHKIANRLCK